MKLDLVLNALNTSQLEAVQHMDTHLIVLAAAGSGKTTTLTSKIAYAIEKQDILPYKILAVTFTNKAAHEMKERLQKMHQPTESLWIGTFHSISARLLRIYGKHIGIPSDFSIIDVSESEKIIKDLLKRHNLNIKYKEAYDYIVDKKDGKSPIFHVEKERMFHFYEKELSYLNVLDFSDLIIKFIHLCNQNPDVENEIKKRFDMILIDEFQDTNLQQFDWLLKIVHDQTHVTVVGDDDQSIYGFRGALPAVFSRFRSLFNASTIKIEENYRSDGYIVDMANYAILNNTSREGKNIEPTKDFNVKPIVRCFKTDKQEAEGVLEWMRYLHMSQHIKYQDMAILYRSHYLSRIFEEAANHKNIPYAMIGGTRFFERQEVKDVMGYVNVLVNCHNNFAVLRIINTPSRGIGKLSTDYLQTKNAQKESLWTTITRCSRDEFKKYKYDKFYHAITPMFRDVAAARTIGDIVDVVLKHSGLVEMYQEDIKADERLANMQELKSIASQYSISDLQDFLTLCSLEPSFSQQLEPSQGVNFMTIHGSKGLEYRVVALVSLENDILPNVNATDLSSLEEERRLFYVAITRAKEFLHLSYAQERLIFGKKNKQKESVFIKNLPHHCYTKKN